MAGVLHIAFYIHGVVAECVGGFSLGHIKLKFEFILRSGHAHPFAAAAGRGLDHHRVADLFCQGDTRLRVVYRLFCSGNYRNACLHHCLAGMGFISHLIDHVRVRSDECDPVLLTSADEFTVFRKESISGMDGVRSHIPGRLYDTVHIQITVFRRSLSDTDPLVGKLHMKAFRILFGIYRHAADPHITACTDNTNGNFSPVGN